MKQLLALLAAAGLTLAACNKEEAPKAAPAQQSAPAPTPANHAPAESAPPTTPPPAEARANEAPAPVVATERRPPAVDAVNDPRRATAQGTLEMFVLCLKEADYETSLLLTDPISDGFAQLQEAMNAMMSAEGKGEEGQESLSALFRIFFTRAWQDTKIEKLGEQDDRVRFRLSFARVDPLDIDVSHVTGEWLVVAPGDVLDATMDNSGLALPEENTTPERPAETPPPPPPSGGN